jgi:hypothetical protein
LVSSRCNRVEPKALSVWDFRDAIWMILLHSSDWIPVPVAHTDWSETLYQLTELARHAPDT